MPIVNDMLNSAWTRLAPVAFPALAFLAALALSQPVIARTLQVGPDHTYTRPSQAAKVAQNGDIIEIAAGDYFGDVALWKADNLTIRGVGGMAHLRSQGKTKQGKAIWVIKGNDTTVEHIGFHDARVSDRNGAGIRLEGRNLTVRHALFSKNQNGILTGGNPESEVRVEHTEFSRNGQGDGQSHNIYIGKIRKFTLQNSVSRLARVGHQVKSRAAENVITNNRLADEIKGKSSYLIDLPNGGVAHIAGNTLQQGELAENFAMISFGAEKKAQHAINSLRIENNTFINDRRAGCRILVMKKDAPPAIVTRNRFVGCKKMDGPVIDDANRYENRSAMPPTSQGD